MEPQKHWKIERGKPPVQMPSRRRASYFYRVPERAGTGRRDRGQVELFESENGQEVELEVVNAIRERVKEWRAGTRTGGVAYDGASSVTRELLELWCSDERMQRLFFAQIGAAETVVFLTEASDTYRKGVPKVPMDEPGPEAKSEGIRAFMRYACKMATGSG
ncbi:MAG: hydrolase, partial [Pseudomonadota bacterium]